jgi:putative serine protease PepD
MQLDDLYRQTRTNRAVAVAQRLYCTVCGSALVDGGCSIHGGSYSDSASAAIEPAAPSLVASPKDRRRWPYAIVIATAVALSTTVGTFGWITGTNARDDVRELREHVAVMARDARAVNAETATVARSLSIRIGTLESVARHHRTPADLARAARPSVFTVETDYALGSAWVATSNNGHSQLITNFHVIAEVYRTGGRDVHVRHGDALYTATVTRVNPVDDLAILSVDVRLPALDVQPKEPAPGDPVLVVGSPLGLSDSVSSGIVSAVRTEGGVRYIQFTAPISPGNSGGPVLDADGEVIGVSVAKAVAPGAEGLSFGVPSARVCADFPVC